MTLLFTLSPAGRGRGKGEGAAPDQARPPAGRRARNAVAGGP